MIVDVHSHLSTLDQWGTEIQEAVRRTYTDALDLDITPQRHREATIRADKVIVFGINARNLGMHTPNDAIANYARTDPKRLVGFMSIDPHDPNAIEELERCVDHLGLQGIKMSPVYQNFEPGSSRAAVIHARAEKLGLPILTHAAMQGISKASLDWASPLTYDSVARQFPDLKIILAHMGLPWFTDAMVMVRKHPNVYADISCGHLRPWWMYQALTAFYESGVLDKLLFGSDFPFASQDETITGLRTVNAVVEGTALPRIPEDAIENIINRDAISLLGLA